MEAISSKNKETSTSEKGKKISLKTFKEKYLTREDQFKYEWANGYVEKTRRIMSENQLFIVRNLLFLFFKVQVIKGKKCQICTDNDLCSADPVIKNFTLTVNEVFK